MYHKVERRLHAPHEKTLLMSNCTEISLKQVITFLRQTKMLSYYGMIEIMI